MPRSCSVAATVRRRARVLVCVSGRTSGNPGIYEVPFGTPLRELLALAARARGRLKAVLLGGAAGGFVRADELDLKLTYEDARATGTTLGSGVVIVSTRRSISAMPCCESRRSSATNHAASACRAAWAPYARKRRCTGSPKTAERRRARAARRTRAGHERRIDLWAGTDRGDRRQVGDQRISACWHERATRPSTASPSASTTTRRSSTRAASSRSRRRRCATSRR